MYKTITALEEVTHIKTMSPALFAVYLIIIGSIGTLSSVPHDYALALIGVLFILYLLLTLLWCFRVRRVLRAYALAEHNFELRMNLVYTGLFTFYYINYCIGRQKDCPVGVCAPVCAASNRAGNYAAGVTR